MKARREEGVGGGRGTGHSPPGQRCGSRGLRGRAAHCCSLAITEPAPDVPVGTGTDLSPPSPGNIAEPVAESQGACALKGPRTTGPRACGHRPAPRTPTGGPRAAPRLRKDQAASSPRTQSPCCL